MVWQTFSGPRIDREVCCLLAGEVVVGGPGGKNGEVAVVAAAAGMVAAVGSAAAVGAGPTPLRSTRQAVLR